MQINIDNLLRLLSPRQFLIVLSDTLYHGSLDTREGLSSLGVLMISTYLRNCISVRVSDIPEVYNRRGTKTELLKQLPGAPRVTQCPVIASTPETRMSEYLAQGAATGLQSLDWPEVKLL